MPLHYMSIKEFIKLNKKQYTIIGNWKMYFTFEQSIDWIKNHLSELQKLYQQTQYPIILCPSFDSLFSIKQELKNSPIGLGAQDCSNHELGAYTGQIAAQSLAEIGCSYCIIGHSERRTYQHETSDEVAQKMQQLIQNNITPILCIGETQQEYEQKLTFAVLKKQLGPISEVLQAYAQADTTLYIAYEPIWSIGTGITPENEYLRQVYEHIHNLANQYPNKDVIRFLYGGSVNGKTAVTLTQVKEIEGFLIGKASTDFQELKKIVLSV